MPQGVLVSPSPLPSDRITWMPSPPLVPDDDATGLIDTGHLGQMTLGDSGLRREVLTLFVRQSSRLLTELSVCPADATAIAHTLKGSARGIGAFAVAECAERLERTAANSSAATAALAELKAAMTATVGAIEHLL